MDTFAPRDSTKDSTIPRFHLRAIENPFKSRQEGRPVFDEVEFVEIIIPGKPLSTAVEPINDSHKTRWPQQYDLFKKGMDAPETGTPLEQWPVLSVGAVANLKALRFRTVEDLAKADDAVLQNMGTGGLTLRTRARDFLEAAHSTAPMERLAQENDILKQQMAAMNDTMAAMKARLDDLDDDDSETDVQPVSRGRGRPRRESITA